MGRRAARRQVLVVLLVAGLGLAGCAGSQQRLPRDRPVVGAPGGVDVSCAYLARFDKAIAVTALKAANASAIDKNKLINEVHKAGSDVTSEIPDLVPAVRALEDEQLAAVTGAPVATIAGDPSHDDARVAMDDAAASRGCP